MLRFTLSKHQSVLCIIDTKILKQKYLKYGIGAPESTEERC